MAACGDRTALPTVTPHKDAVRAEMLVATVRDENSQGNLSAARRDGLGFYTADVAIPPMRKSGNLRARLHHPNPKRDFLLAGKQQITGQGAFLREVKSRLAKLPKNQREVVVFIHGYNNSFADGVFRTAQMRHDMDVSGVMVHFSWPSAAHPLGYTHDRDSALYARDDLETFLRAMSRAGISRIVLVGHSMGGFLTMETLRQIDIATPGWSRKNIAGTVLIAPDIDTLLFRKQISRLKDLPQPFMIFTSEKDRVLLLSERVNGSNRRLGRLSDVSDFSDLPLLFIDVSRFSDPSRATHFVPGTSPALISILKKAAQVGTSLEAGADARAGLLPGTAITVQNATRLILSPNIVETAP